MNENEYINISKAFSSSLVEKADASIALNSFVPINRVAEAKDLKSNRSLRLEKLIQCFWICTIEECTYRKCLNLSKQLIYVARYGETAWQCYVLVLRQTIDNSDLNSIHHWKKIIGIPEDLPQRVHLRLSGFFKSG